MLSPYFSPALLINVLCRPVNVCNECIDKIYLEIFGWLEIEERSQFVVRSIKF